MIRKTIIVVLVLASLATGVMWIDSYRPRKPTALPLAPEQDLGRWWGIIDLKAISTPYALVGFVESIYFGDRRRFSIRAYRGSLNLRLDLGIKTGTPIPRKDFQLLGFRHKQRMWRCSTSPGRDGKPDIHDEYHVREVTLPFLALFVVLSWYPFLAFIRGPLRRHRRRRRGECIGCGYDMTGNVSGVCPECGFAIVAKIR